MASETEEPDTGFLKAVAASDSQAGGLGPDSGNVKSDHEAKPVEATAAWSDAEFFEIGTGTEDGEGTFPLVDDSPMNGTPVALYDLDDIRAALGLRPASSDWPSEVFGSDSEHQSRLSAILKDGERGRWRHALGPTDDSEAAIVALVERAPHFAELGYMLLTNAKAARAIGLPMFIHPVLLIGEPGLGKTWFLSQLARLLGLPFRTYSMSMSTLGEGLQGSHPSWRNAQPGLVAKTLLREKVANPIVFVDEFDKVVYGSWNSDPYRPFYTLLDPSGSKTFVDEYLGFGIDASKVLWIMAANDYSKVPAPILDRLTVIHVPIMAIEQRTAVVWSIYAEANTDRFSFFEPELEKTVLEALVALNPRRVRIAIESAMARAAADNRHKITPADVKALNAEWSETQERSNASQRKKTSKLRLN